MLANTVSPSRVVRGAIGVETDDVVSADQALAMLRSLAGVRRSSTSRLRTMSPVGISAILSTARVAGR